MSLSELRRQLLHKWDSLQKAFNMLETKLDNGRLSGGKRMSKKMSLSEFTQAVAFFGLDRSQAHHFFHLMDKNGDGDLTLTEFKKALTDMPREVLLQDLRVRLLKRHRSIPEAFKELVSSDEVCRSRPLDRAAFASKLLRWGVDDQEAQSLFKLIDQDQSGTISLEELRASLREVAPWVSLDEFWRRFAVQWPDIAQCAGGGAHARRRGTEKLFALVSPAHRGFTKELPESLSSVVFADICMELDITQSNSIELFELCATSAKWQCRRRSDSDVLCLDCDLDDFFDGLHLWSENPLNQAQLTPRARRRGSVNDVAKHLAPVRCVLKALKGQLSSFKPREEPREGS
jgi:Ca2+-binding EF-hand superfamily protein